MAAISNPNFRYELSREGLPVGVLVPESERALCCASAGSLPRSLRGTRRALREARREPPQLSP